MYRRFRSKLNYSNVIATVALFAALSGVAVAANLPKNSVGPKQLKKGAVTAAKLRKGSITGQKIANGGIIPGKLAANAVGAGNIGNGAVTSPKLGKGAVNSTAIANGAVANSKLANEAVTTTKLANGSVTAAKLSTELGPQLGSLKAGQTLRGVFYVKFNAAAGGEFGSDSASYQFPISGNPPAVTVLKKDQTNANCAGIGSGSAPTATAGNLCVYLTEEVNLDETTPLEAFNNQRLGFGLGAKAKNAGEAIAAGQWAVTAP